jgi:hypothetical protein
MRAMAADRRRAAVRFWGVVAGAAPPLLGLAAPDARAAQLFAENFEGLALRPFVSGTESDGDGTDWTDAAPAGWSRNNGTTPGFGPREFFGFTFMDWSSWIATEMNQERVMFTRGVGAVMVADGDAYCDIAELPADSFNVLMTTPPIPLTNVRPGTAVLHFDSSFRPRDRMTATVEVSFDAGSDFDTLLTMTSANTVGGDDSLGRVDEGISLPLNNPAGVTDMLIRFGLRNADNDWWWAIDNIDVQGEAVPEPSSAGVILLGMAGLVMSGRRR